MARTQHRSACVENALAMAEQYAKCECIGKGSFGEVYKGKELATGKTVALKLVDLEKADEEIEVIQREIKVMSQISNPYVVQYYSSLMYGSTLWIVMEFMAAGSLKELLDAVGPFPEEAIATVMKALFRGLDYVHKGQKVHRDIKAANILLSDQGDVKLADFGVAGQMTATMRQRNTFVGSPFWMAPEVIQESSYDEKADIWSAGITGLELANGVPPYAREHPYRALFLIPKNDPPRLEGSHFSKSCKEFLSLCLKKNPAERPSAEQLLTHSFMKKARSSSVRELLKKKYQADPTDLTEKVVIGGDSFTGSPSATYRPQSSTANEETEAQENPKLWEFDFGSLTDSQADAKEKAEASEVQNGEVRDVHTDGREECKKAFTDIRSSNTVSEENELSEALAPQRPPENIFLSELVLPVISQIRGDVDARGSYNQSLMSSLGALEVALVDIESARPGICTVLLESILREGLNSPSEEIRNRLRQCLQNGDANANRA